MKAVLFRQHGGPEHFELAEIPKPAVAPHEVLVRVRACALNHLDIWVRQGLPGIPVQMPHICGSDIAGEIAEIGDAARYVRKDLNIGQRVVISPGISCGLCESCARGEDSNCAQFDIMGLRRQGGYAEFAQAPARDILPVSDKLSFEEWAAIPLVFLTAWHMLITRGGLRAGETVLVHAAGSGIGSAAIQIAKLAGATVITTAGSDEKLARGRQLGADHSIHYGQEDFPGRVRDLTGGRGVDLIFEHIGPENWDKNLACLARGGRMVFCGATSGATVKLNLRAVFARQHSLIGCYMGGRHELSEVIRLVELGKLKPVMDKVFPLEQAAAAHQRMLDRKNFGKIVLKI